MADDAVMLRELCNYQSQELKELKQKLKNCKCTDGGPSSPADNDELKRLKAEVNPLKELLVTKDEELDNLQFLAKDASSDVKPKIVLRIMDPPVASPSDPGHREQEQEWEGSLVDWKEKYSTLRAKYKVLKASNAETKSALEHTRTGLESAVAAAKSIDFDPTLHKRQTMQRIDDFIRETAASTENIPSIESLEVYGSDMPRGTLKATIGVKPLPVIVDESDCIFSSTGISHLLFLMPTHQFTPKSNNGSGAWGKVPSIFGVHPTRNVLLSTSLGFKTLGLYKCFFQDDLDSASVRDLRGLLSNIHLPSLVRRTIGSADLVPPFMVRSVQGMYDSGAMGAVVYALQRVGSDQVLSDAIRALDQRAKRKTQPVAQPARQPKHPPVVQLTSSGVESASSHKRSNSNTTPDSSQGKVSKRQKLKETGT